MQFYGEDDLGPNDIRIVVNECRDTAVFFPGVSEFKKLAEIDRLPIRLSRVLFRWMQEHPHYRVRSTMPIIEDFYTVAIHVWFDRLWAPNEAQTS
jgi:hypothetical protein